jgi:uncharacterized protein (DUF1330 family)
MPAYLVFLCEEVSDRRELEAYWSKIKPTFEGHVGTPLAAYTPFEILEDGQKRGPIHGVSIHEFPSVEAAKAWYDSPAYREIREKHRFKGAKYLGMIVEGGYKPADERMAHTKNNIPA